jgi:hypothetical protein
MLAAAIEDLNGMRQQTANKINTWAKRKRRVMECESGRPWEAFTVVSPFLGSCDSDSTVWFFTESRRPQSSSG